MSNMDRIDAIVARLPEAERVNIEQWGDHPALRVRKKNFVFSDPEGYNLSLKLSREEAAAVVATDPAASPAGYGLGKHGWISLAIGPDADDDRWTQIEEWIHTSYTLVAPKSLTRTLPAT